MPQIVTEVVAEGLPHLWAMEFLPDGRMLVSAKEGEMMIVTAEGEAGEPIAGVPEVASDGQGGLLDIALSPQFASDQTIYFSFSEPRDGGNGTSVAKARLVEDGGTASLEDLEIIFRQMPTYDGDKHFGSRIVPDGRGGIFVTTGERSVIDARPLAQDVNTHLGKVLHIDGKTGAPLSGNPFAQGGGKPEIWSWGHRNIQSAALDGQGRLWTVEHGAKGGDEVNIPQPGKNYGWPVISFGVNYDGTPVGSGKSSMPGMEQPIKYWVPSIAPSGMAFYTGDLFPSWKGSLFVGALAGQMLVRLSVDGETITGEERLLQGLRERIRDVRMGPDGALYLVTDNNAGRVLKVTPAK